MKTLIKKEIRLLLPAWIAAMVLAIVPRLFVILYTSPGNPAYYHWLSSIAGIVFQVGLLFLGINSFGQELSCNTFSALLSQPMKRPRIWRIKIATLATAFILVWLTAILFTSLQLGVYYSYFQGNERPDLSEAVEVLTLSALVVFSGGLWTTLLLRQITGAFWFTLLTPLAIAFGISTVIQDWLGWDNSVGRIIAAALLLYSIGGFFLARRLFMRAQDVQWTGGEVSLPFGRGTSKASWRRGSAALPVRTRHRYSALAWKELQLHQGTFLIAAFVLVLHLSTVFLRIFHPHIQNSNLEFLFENFWMLWLLMPLLIGAAAIAEERRMGTLEPQLCQPVSRPTQLFLKFSFALLLSLFFGALVPALIEASIGASVGDSGLWLIGEKETLDTINVFADWHWVAVVAVATFFVSFYASSLGRTALQGIGFAILVSLVIYLYEVATALIIVTGPMREFHFNPQFGIEFLNRRLGAGSLVLALGWLTFSNFKHVQQNRNFWVRNIAAILAVFICAPIVARAIYFRPWEVLLPMEPRGPVRITSPAQVKLVVSMDAIYAISPNGLLWSAPYTYNLNHVDSGRGQFIGGSNWVDVAVNQIEVLAVQSNGTLWRLGGGSVPAPMTQIGTDNDWSYVAGGFSGFLILKKNGSLWAWGIHPFNWTSQSSLNQKLQHDLASPPVRVSSETNWTALYSTHLFSPYARNNNGNLWLLEGKHLIQETNVDNQWLSLQFDNSLSHVEVQTNGDLVYFDQHFHQSTIMGKYGRPLKLIPGRRRREQLGQPWKWETVTLGPINGWQAGTAIRSDGTLWKFPLRQPPRFILEPPVQLGSRSDWVAVSQGFSLASDGSIWTWNENSDYYWLAPSRRPVCVGNIFEGLPTAHGESHENAN